MRFLEFPSSGILSKKIAMERDVDSLVDSLLSKTQINLADFHSKDVDLVFYLPSYNSELTIANSLLSLLRQAGVNHQIVVFDDGSSDRTCEILGEFALSNKNLIAFEAKENSGQLIATNVARKLALSLFPQSSFIALASDHDLWEPNFGNQGIKILNDHSEAVWFVPRYYRYEFGRYNCEHSLRIELDFFNVDGDFHCQCRRDGKELHPRLSSIEIWKRIWASHQLNAGSTIYGIERKSQQACNDSFYFPCIGPDQLYLLIKLIEGSLVTSEEVTWHRVQFNSPDKGKTIQNLFGSEMASKLLPSKMLLRFPRFSHIIFLIFEEKFGRRVKVMSPFLLINIQTRKLFSPIRKLRSLIRKICKFLKRRIRELTRRFLRLRRRGLKRRIRKLTRRFLRLRRRGGIPDKEIKFNVIQNRSELNSFELRRKS
ncbi:MAG: glycosyltransferase [Actinobacteria bacterium]|uniref:Unannotated protein n=1 Tax=freshwater metagenome TaxID=449393 RepID=A0A6J5Z5P2_9ZZZZ|nr:glycosyltransferase [Actinomycetota bacterium]MSX71504.1 glycosyltransferase [Actinomycetota bacterium]MSY69625.1 glycosyltransferase [Actinomycetota bacterium]